MHHLLPEFSAMENVAMPGRIAGQSRASANQRARDLLKQVGLEGRWKHRPGELSGGEQQRVAIARALFNQPGLLLADEPTGDLDGTTAREIFQLLMKFNRERGQTLVVVSHNPELAREADRVITLQDGRIV
jgi:lipoprotein-releasing system ATP-binding protein